MKYTKKRDRKKERQKENCWGKKEKTGNKIQDTLYQNNTQKQSSHFQQECSRQHKRVYSTSRPQSRVIMQCSAGTRAKIQGDK